MKTIALSLVIVTMSMGCSGADPEASATETPGSAEVADTGGSSGEWALDGSPSGGDDETPTAVDSGSAPKSSDAGAPATDSGAGKIACGTETCSTATQDCCSNKCVLKGTCLSAGAKCSDPSTCGSGEVCCKGLTSTTCSKSCMGGLRLCTTNAQCGSGEACTTGLGGIKYCAASFGSFFDAGTSG